MSIHAMGLSLDMSQIPGSPQYAAAHPGAATTSLTRGVTLDSRLISAPGPKFTVRQEPHAVQPPPVHPPSIVNCGETMIPGWGVVPTHPDATGTRCIAESPCGEGTHPENGACVPDASAPPPPAATAAPNYLLWGGLGLLVLLVGGVVTYEVTR